MKKIYTIIGQQELSKSFYGDANHQLYGDFNEKTMFPITTYLSKIVKKGEEFIVVVVDAFDSEKSNNNIVKLKDEITSYYGDNFSYEVMKANFAYEQKAQIQTFMELYKTFKPNDEVYFDITFGLKPTPMTVFVACNYAKKFIEGIKICNLVYAHYDFNADENAIHPIIDITSIFLLNNLIDTLSDMNSTKPMNFIEKVFDLGD